MNYVASDEIKKKNCKGLLATDGENRVIRPKLAYDAVRNLVSVYDNLDAALDSSAVTVDGAMAYLFEDAETRLQSAVLWLGGAVPDDGRDKAAVPVRIRDFRCRRPVCIDLLDGRITPIRMERKGTEACFSEVPVYDSPIVICDDKLISR